MLYACQIIIKVVNRKITTWKIPRDITTITDNKLHGYSVPVRQKTDTKHLGCKKCKVNQKQPLSNYTYDKSFISG